MLSKATIVIITTTFVILLALSAFYAFHEKNTALETKCWVINLKKNKDRLERFEYFYKNSDLATVPLNRFEAINGRELDPKRYVSKIAYDTLLLNEKNKYRTKHYQLTRGAIGCYLSHASIYKKLLQDPVCDYYVIFEDDAAVLPRVVGKLGKALENAPTDWDMIILAPIMEVILERNSLFKRYESFWGLSAYLISKRGAAKFIEEFEKKPISMQIDSKMSLMIAENGFKVYGYNQKIVWHDRTTGTDIQMPLKRLQNVNPFLIEEL